jgi:hypothetical protein
MHYRNHCLGEPGEDLEREQFPSNKQSCETPQRGKIDDASLSKREMLKVDLRLIWTREFPSLAVMILLR